MSSVAEKQQRAHDISLPQVCVLQYTQVFQLLFLRTSLAAGAFFRQRDRKAQEGMVLPSSSSEHLQAITRTEATGLHHFKVYICQVKCGRQHAGNPAAPGSAAAAVDLRQQHPLQEGLLLLRHTDIHNAGVTPSTTCQLGDSSRVGFRPTRPSARKGDSGQIRLACSFGAVPASLHVLSRERQSVGASGGVCVAAGQQYSTAQHHAAALLM